jgi:hypothetical protein
VLEGRADERMQMLRDHLTELEARAHEEQLKRQSVNPTGTIPTNLSAPTASEG